MSATCDGCESLAAHRAWWADELGDVAYVLSLALETRDLDKAMGIVERLKDLRDRIGR